MSGRKISFAEMSGRTIDFLEYQLAAMMITLTVDQFRMNVSGLEEPTKGLMVDW